MVSRLKAAALALLLALSVASLPASADINSGVYTLAARAITTALLAEAQTAIVDLDGMTAVTFEAFFQYGSGGTSVSAVAQTSTDGGTTWDDVCRFDFTTATAKKSANVSGYQGWDVSDVTSLGSAGCNKGLLGDRLRVIITSIGTYVNTTLSVRASVR